MCTRTVQPFQKVVLLCVMFCTILVMSASAQAAFITDKLVISIYSERFGQGTVLKTLSSGTNVTVLMNDGDYSRIRTSDNVTGWVESKYITNEKPAQLEYLELLARSKTLEANLKTAEEKLATQTTTGSESTEGLDVAELAELRKRAADAGWMRVELKKSRDRVSELEDQLKSKNQKTSTSQEELKSLREKNKMLEERLAAALLVNEQQDITEQPGDASPESVSDTSGQNRYDDGWSVKIGWFLGSIVVALITGLVAGMTWLDKRIRQRHGGFRIY